MKRPTARRGAALAAITCLAAPLALPAAAGTDHRAQPEVLIVDHSLPRAQVAEQVLAARTYATFWTTGDEAQARAALAARFTDRTLPAGRPQGIAGPLAASKAFHDAVPDVHCQIEQMLVVGDRVVSHLHFTGHFTGTFKGSHGQGQKVDFIATDIYRMRDGRITDNWHLEDNLTFLQQLGVVTL